MVNLHKMDSTTKDIVKIEIGNSETKLTRKNGSNAAYSLESYVAINVVFELCMENHVKVGDKVFIGATKRGKKARASLALILEAITSHYKVKVGYCIASDCYIINVISAKDESVEPCAALRS